MTERRKYLLLYSFRRKKSLNISCTKNYYLWETLCSSQAKHGSSISWHSVLCAISDYSVMHHLLVVFQGMIGNCNTCSISDLRYFRSVKLTKELCKRTIFWSCAKWPSYWYTKKVNLTHKHFVKLIEEKRNELFPSEEFIGLKSAELSSIFISSLSVN